MQRGGTASQLRLSLSPPPRLPVLEMAVRDLPWGMIALSGIVAAFTYSLVRLINERRFYKDLVCRTTRGACMTNRASPRFMLFLR